MITQTVLHNDEFFFEMLLGFVLVFAANTLLQVSYKSEKINSWLRVMYCTAMAYLFTAVRTVTEFFVDYYSKTTCLQKYNGVPSQGLFLYKILGSGTENPDQYPVFDLDLVFLSFVIGSALASILLLFYYKTIQKEKWLSEPVGLKRYIRNEISELKTGVYPLEYISWWVLRLAMITVTIYGIFTGKRQGVVVTMLFVNTLMTFIIPIFRFVFFLKLFLGNIPYRVQTFINVFVFMGSFLGHGLDVLYKIPEYDKIQHLISGGITLLIGYVILENRKEAQALPTRFKVVGSLGLANVVMIVWEVFEFFTDFLIQGSDNQNFHFVPTSDMLFIKIFGFGRGKLLQYPVMDTNIDIICAVAGVMICIPVLLAWIHADNANRAKTKNKIAVAGIVGR